MYDYEMKWIYKETISLFVWMWLNHRATSRLFRTWMDENWQI